MIHAYLSYKTKISSGALRRFKEICKEHKIELKYSEKELETGDDFVEFMQNHLIGARFLILFLSPEYFASAYCLYELISITAAINAGRKIFVYPIRVSKELTALSETKIRETLLKDRSDDVQAAIGKLTKLQGKEWSEKK